MKIFAFLVALVIGAMPLAASASTDLIGFRADNPGATGIGISTSILRVGPLQVSPAIIAQQENGVNHFSGGALILSANVARVFDVGVGVFQRPVGSFALNSEHFQPGVSLGLRL